MIPYEAILPYGVMFSLLTICGGGMSAIHFFRNDFKRERYNLDRFDTYLIERDYRLTGSYRGQSDTPTAPDSFKVNSIWKLSKPHAS